jgi:hypothetical protein
MTSKENSFRDCIDGLVQQAHTDINEPWPTHGDILDHIEARYGDELLDWVMNNYTDWAEICGETISFTPVEFNALMTGILRKGKPSGIDLRGKARTEVMSLIGDHHDMQHEVEEMCLRHGINGNPRYANEHERDFQASR